jgi:type I restriction enzyme M protein
MNTELRSKLDRIINLLFTGGSGNPVTYLEQLSFLIYLKLLDEEEARRELHGCLSVGSNRSIFPGQSSRYRWGEWRSKSGIDLRDFIRDEVFPYTASLVRDEPQVALYFQDARLEIEDANMLKEIVNELDGISLLNLGADVKGEAYEYLLQQLAMKEGALLGQFRTPQQIRQMMVQMLDPELGDSIFDPACGTGGLLIDGVEHILAKHSEKPSEIPIYGEEWLENRGQRIDEAKNQIVNLQTRFIGAGENIPDWKVLEQSVYGIEVSRQMMRVSLMNLLLHGIRNANIKRANALSEMPDLTDEDLKPRYNVILSSPPFAGLLPKEFIRKDDPLTESKKSELLFLALVMESLAPGGRAAVLMPEGLFFGLTIAHVQLRRKLIENFDLQAVISLPTGVFKPYAGVKTGVLIFRRPIDEKRDKHGGHVWFAEVRNDGYDSARIIQGRRTETPDKNDIPDVLAAWADYKKSEFSKPPGVSTGEFLPPGAPEPKFWWSPVSLIVESNFDLAAGRYKPQVEDKPPDEDPVELIHKTLMLEREIAGGLEKLLKKMEVTK